MAGVCGFNPHNTTAMEALAITIFCSVLLAGFFVVMFLGSQRGRRLGLEQEALLPLEDDFRAHSDQDRTAQPSPTTSPTPSQHSS